jgi:AraC-like DNA-binding protein
MTNISFNIWSVIILLGAGQGLFLSFYLFTKIENRDANKWLAFLLTAVSLHLLEYAADISGIALKYPFLVAITYPLLFCMGPLYFLYCRYLLDKDYHTSCKTLLHFIPAVLVLLLMLPFYLMPASEKVIYLQGLSSNGTLEIPAGQLVFMGTHVFQTVAYVWISYQFIGKKEEEVKRISSDVFSVRKLDWLRSFSFYFSIYLGLYFVLVVVLTFAHSFQIQIDYVMLFITSLSLYSIGYVAIGNPEVFKSTQEMEATESVGNNTALPENGNNPDRYRDPELKDKLLHYMETNKPYLKSDLKISELADSLSVPYYQLSQLINNEFSVNFYDFINKYRLEEAKKLLIEDTRNYKILSIAFEVGFNSKATFNRVFKNATGLTPSAFREKFSTSRP